MRKVIRLGIVLLGLLAATEANAQLTPIATPSSVQITTDSTATSTSHGRAGGKWFYFRDSSWSTTSPCVYWGMPRTLVDAYNAVDSGSCTDMVDLNYWSGLSNPAQGFLGYFAEAVHHFRYNNTLWVTRNQDVTVYIRIYTMSGTPIPLTNWNNQYFVWKVNQDFKVHVLFRSEVIPGTQLSGSLSDFEFLFEPMFPSIDVFDAWSTNPAHQICTSFDIENFFEVDLLGNATNTGPYCYGDTVKLNGSALAGSTFSWSGPSGFSSKSEDTTHLPGIIPSPSTYQLAVSGTLSCKDTLTTTVIMESMPEVTIDTSRGTDICGADSVLFTAPFDSDYSYQWRESGTDIPGAVSDSFYATIGGNYDVIVYKNALCRDTSNQILVYTRIQPVASATTGNDSICNGDAYLLLSANSSSLEHQWLLNGAPVVGADTTFYAATSAGIYSLQVSDGTCRDTSATFELKVNPKPPAFILPGANDYCAGHDFVLYASTTAGSTYGWLKDGINQSVSTDTLLVNGSGSYRLIETNSIGCKDTSAARLVTEKPLPSMGLSLSGDSTFCLGESVLMTAATGGTYTWYKDGVSLAVNDSFYSATSTGLYHVISVLNACTDSSRKVEVTVNPLPTGSIATLGDSTFCEGDSISLSFTPSVGNSFQWLFNGSAISGATGSAYDAKLAGAYTVAVTNSYGCKDTSYAVNVNVNTRPTASFNIPGNTFICAGDSTLLSASGNGLSYQWYKSGNVLSGATAQNYYALDSGTYYVRAVDANSCADTSAMQAVTLAPTPVASLVMSTDSILCADQNAVLHAASQNGWTFQWQRNSANILLATDSFYSASLTGNYRFIVQNSFACKDTSRIQSILINPLPTAAITAGGDTTFCDGDSVLLNAQTGLGYSYNWYFGSSLTGETGTSYYALDSGVYRLIVQDGNGCIDTSAWQRVDAFTLPTAVVAAGGPTSFCEGDSVLLSTTTLPGGFYNWLFEGTPILNFSTSTYAADSGVYSLEITDANGCKDTSALVNVAVYPNPVANFTINDTGQCRNDQAFEYIELSTLSSGNYSVFWDLGDGSVATTNQVNTVYGQAGAFNVKLVVTSTFGCADSITQAVAVHPKPNPSFLKNSFAQCLNGNSFQFSNTTTLSSGTLSYLWRFNDGDSSQATSPTHSFNAAGTFDVELVAISDLACRDSTSQSITIYPNPVVGFTINDTGQCFNDQAFLLTDTSSISSGFYGRVWTLGDDSTSSAQSFIKTYLNNGNYQIRLVLTSLEGCIDSAVQSVSVYPTPQVQFTVNDSIQCEKDNEFIFTNTSNISSGTISSQWEYGNGITSTTTSPTYVYPVDGTYYVKLLVTSNFQCSDSITRTMRVHASPVAIIGAMDSIACFNTQNFNFIDSSTINTGSLTRTWTFGDGGSSNGNYNSYTYAAPGIYPVQLVELSNRGCRDTANLQVTVHPKPYVNFVSNDSTQCRNDQNFVFTNLSTISSGTQDSYWDFGDGTTSNLASPIHIFPTDSFYNVKLLMVSDQGCRDSLRRTTFVYPVPNVGIVINQNQQCLVGNNYYFDGQAAVKSGAVTNYAWSLGSGLSSILQDTAVQYTSAGTRYIRFIATTNLSCRDTAYDTVTVHANPLADFSINNPEQCLSGNYFTFTNLSTVSVGGMAYQWDLGQGMYATSQDTQVSYLNHDSLQVKLWVTSDFGCQDTLSKDITIHAQPDAQFIVNDSDQCVNGNRFLFTNQSTNAYKPIFYQWTFGDGSQSQGLNPQKIYTAPGTYIAKLKTTFIYCSDSVTHTMVVRPKPTVSVTVNDAGQCVNDHNFIFTANNSITSGTLKTYWKFGDLQEDSLANTVAHQYPFAGYFNATMISMSDQGCKDSAIQAIQVLKKPDATFLINSAAQCVNNQNFVFSNQSIGGAGNISSLNWDLGDGNTASTANVSHFYAQNGHYSVTLMARNDSGCYDTVTNTIRVYPKPRAQIGFTDSAQCLKGNAYDFYSLSTDSIGIQGFLWNITDAGLFGDSAFIYSFKADGPKTAELIVQSTYYCRDTVSRDVYVKTMPIAGFTGMNKFYCEGSGVYPLVAGTAGGTFSGPNMQGSDYVPTNLWEDSVSYTVELDGCYDTSKQYTNVYPYPVIGLGSDTTLCQFEYMDLNVTFWNSSYTWDDGLMTPIRRISQPGTYTVKVRNQCGTASDAITVSFKDDNCRVFLPTAFTPDDNNRNDNYKPTFSDVITMDYKIFDRWGMLMHEGNINDNGWDGKVNGAPATIDVYVVVVKFTFELPDGIATGEAYETFHLMR
ncbi:MAG: PKD domain-containing protein [Bacteroidetes bacterium]|nr:MAG: PKD domain-containing protein [Bacteroidota bacterium]